MYPSSRTAALALAATSTLAVMTGAFASGASAATSTVYLHNPGTLWSTKAACAPYAANYVKMVKAKGYTIDSDVPQECRLTDFGWTYRTAYNVPKSKAPLGADAALYTPATLANIRFDYQSWKTVYSHTRSFTSLIKCRADRNVFAAKIARGEGTRYDTDAHNVTTCFASDSTRYLYNYDYRARIDQTNSPGDKLYRLAPITGEVIQAKVGMDGASEEWVSVDHSNAITDPNQIILAFENE